MSNSGYPIIPIGKSSTNKHTTSASGKITSPKPVVRINKKVITEQKSIMFTDGDKQYSVSTAFITALEQRTPYTIIRKIGEGGYNLVLLAQSSKDNKQYCLLVDKNIQCISNPTFSSGTQLIANMQSKGLLNTSIVQVYENFILEGVKLSTDAAYCPKIKINSVMVQVEEYIAGITLDEKIFRVSKQDRNAKIIFFLQLKQKMEQLLAYIRVKGLEYIDL